MSLIHVLVVADDARLLRRHACAVLGEPALRLAAAVSGGRAAIALLAALTPDVLLIDPELGDVDGIELIRHAARQYPCCAVLVVTPRCGGDGDERGAAALAAGAAGCLGRDAAPERIAAGIREVHADGARSGLAMRGRVLPRLRNPPDAPDAAAAASVRLTGREAEILRLIEKGLPFDTVGELLEISTHTVVAHLRNIYRKLAVHTRGEAVHEASQMGLL